MADTWTIAAPVLLKLAADILERQGQAREADEVRVIVARVEKTYDEIIAHEQARSSKG